MRKDVDAMKKLGYLKNAIQMIILKQLAIKKQESL